MPGRLCHIGDLSYYQIFHSVYLFYTFSGEKIPEICKLYPELILPHPLKCQQYFNCSMLEDRQLNNGFCHPVLHLTECIYPYLFSIDTLQCENFTEVKCGSRHEEKNYCKKLELLALVFLMMVKKAMLRSLT